MNKQPSSISEYHSDLPSVPHHSQVQLMAKKSNTCLKMIMTTTNPFFQTRPTPFPVCHSFLNWFHCLQLQEHNEQHQLHDLQHQNNTCLIHSHSQSTFFASSNWSKSFNLSLSTAQCCVPNCHVLILALATRTEPPAIESLPHMIHVTVQTVSKTFKMKSCASNDHTHRAKTRTMRSKFQCNAYLVSSQPPHTNSILDRYLPEAMTRILATWHQRITVSIPAFAVDKTLIHATYNNDCPFTNLVVRIHATSKTTYIAHASITPPTFTVDFSSRNAWGPGAASSPGNPI